MRTAPGERARSTHATLRPRDPKREGTHARSRDTDRTPTMRALWRYIEEEEFRNACALLNVDVREMLIERRKVSDSLRKKCSFDTDLPCSNLRTSQVHLAFALCLFFLAANTVRFWRSSRAVPAASVHSPAR